MKARVFFGLALGLIIAGMPVAWPAPQQGQDPAAAILHKAQEYCRRLDRAVLDFACREEVMEEVNIREHPPATTIIPPPENWGGTTPKMMVIPAPPDSFRSYTYVYNYLFIRRGGSVQERRDRTDVDRGPAIQERRDLAETNGRKTVKTDAVPETKHFKFRDIAFGPSALLGEGAADKFIYSTVKTKKMKGATAILVDCAPRPENEGKLLSGRAWIREKDGAVLRIEWNPESFGSYGEVMGVANRYKMTPRVESWTEFGEEKNGICFPSLDRTEEAYSGGGSMLFVRSKTTIRYKDYKFFMVEVEVR
jgi:hypothetical protein